MIEAPRCTCWDAGNGMKWHNLACPVHSNRIPASRSDDSPQMPADFGDKLKEAFDKLKNKKIAHPHG